MNSQSVVGGKNRQEIELGFQLVIVFIDSVMILIPIGNHVTLRPRRDPITNNTRANHPVELGKDEIVPQNLCHFGSPSCSRSFGNCYHQRLCCPIVILESQRQRQRTAVVASPTTIHSIVCHHCDGKGNLNQPTSLWTRLGPR